MQVAKVPPKCLGYLGFHKDILTSGLLGSQNSHGITHAPRLDVKIDWLHFRVLPSYSHFLKLGYGNEQLERHTALRAVKILGTAHVTGALWRASS